MVVLRKDYVAGVRVTTVLLAQNQNSNVNGPPILWETKVLGGIHDQYTRRYCSENEAIAGHGEIVAMLKW
jgi:hypothetical protein